MELLAQARAVAIENNKTGIYFVMELEMILLQKYRSMKLVQMSLQQM